MPRKYFKYYLHDDAEFSEMVTTLLDQGFSQDAAEKVAEGRPFYEVELTCTADTETGEVTYHGVSST